MDKKRKNEDEDNLETVESDQEQDQNFDENEIVDVDFDFFDPTEIDFQAVKNLLRSLFDSDADNFHLSTFADAVLDKKNYGTTIKVDGKESDPYALFSVIDLSGKKTDPAYKKLIEYYFQKTGKKPEFTRKLRQILTPDSKDKVAIIFSERFINMPVELAPPLYRLYLDSLKEQGAEYDYYLIMSKTFTEEESDIDKEEKRPNKRNKFQNPKEFYYFHPEDQVIHDTCQYYTSYSFSKEVQLSDSKRAFQNYGIYPHGHVMLLAHKDLEKTVENMEAKFPPPQ